MYGIQIFILVVVIHNLAMISIANPVDIPAPLTQPKSRVDLFRNVFRPACLSDDRNFGVTSGQTDRNRRWKNFYVQLDPAYTSSEKNAINNAMYELSQVLPCVNFGMYSSTAKPSGDYVYIKKGTNNGCDSYVGRIGGKQNMNLQSPGCMSKATIIHEMIHALGFHHEQCREDRDHYVTVYFDNIEAGMEHNFEKYTGEAYSSFGVAYNPKSIMHYNTFDFSKNRKPTITTKSGGLVGSDGVFHNSDKQKLKNMYKC